MWAGGVDTLHVSQLSLGTDDSLYDSWMRRVPLLNGLYHCGRPIAAIQQTGGGLLDGKGPPNTTPGPAQWSGQRSTLRSCRSSKWIIHSYSISVDQ